MTVLIDTNIAIYLTEDRLDVQERVLTLDAPPVISLITWIELESGIYKDPDRALARRLRLDELLRSVAVLPCDAEVVGVYSDIVAALGFSRSRLLDRLIAATAIAADLLLVTSNGPDFANIPDLKLEIWARPAQ